MKKIPFVTKEQIEKIAETYPTPFYIYDEKGIRENARKLKQAFSWNKLSWFNCITHSFHLGTMLA